MNPLLSVLANIYIMAAFYGIVVKEIHEKIQDILDFSELEAFAQTPVRFLSTGQMLRLTFAVFTQTRDNFLAFDENPGFGDLRFEQKARQYFNQLIADPEKTILMASHDLDMLPQYCHRALWIHEGLLRMDGPVPEVLKAYRDFCQTPATPLPLKEYAG
jgi:ABC-2 type transport system ATP-binding protein